MNEYIYAFTYKPSPKTPVKIGSLWAANVKEAAQQAALALASAYPDHVKGKLFRASNTRSNANHFPVKDPDGDGTTWLTPKQALAKEQERWRRA